MRDDVRQRHICVTLKRRCTESEVMTDSEELNELMADLLLKLQACREFIDDGFEAHGFDMAFFDVKINLEVQVDNLRVGVHDEWKRLEP